MTGQTSITLKLPSERQEEVRSLLGDQGFDFDEAPYAFWRARGFGCTATFYQKGKLLIQGKDAESWAAMLGVATDPEDEAVDPFTEALGLHPSPPPERWVGIDETGKGDYFGPLIVVAAAVERERVPLLRELGVGDSKGLTDKRIGAIARDLKACCVYRKVVIGPTRYNALYERIGNLNRLLGWAHARALEDVLAMAPDCTWALSDQFAKDRRVVGNQLMERGRAIRWDQRTKAESDPAVAAASVLARDELLWQMRKLEKQVGRRLPKGAGPPVLAAAREIAAESGLEVLSKVAKLHFKTTQQLGL